MNDVLTVHVHEAIAAEDHLSTDIQYYRNKDAIYSVYPPTAFLTFAYWIYAVPPFKPKDMLMLGYAGGTVAGLVQQIYGDVPITGVDQTIYDNRYHVNLVKADARDFVKLSKPYDCVIVDLFDGLLTPSFVGDPDFAKEVCRITGDFLVIYLTEFSYQSSSKILGSLNSWPCAHSEA